jgi:biopolymer transport protein ExbB/TolQ
VAAAQPSARALPALGFIGTVLGILYGLDGADAIVRASGQEERAAAMSVVTGPLALAFSTTFFALVAGLLMGLMIDRETAHERLLLFAFEEALVERIDPAERGIEPVE